MAYLLFLKRYLVVYNAQGVCAVEVFDDAAEGADTRGYLLVSEATLGDGSDGDGVAFCVSGDAFCCDIIARYGVYVAPRKRGLLAK